MCIVTGFNVFDVHSLKNMWSLITSTLAKRVQVIMTCGLTPQKLALTLCLGIAFGVIPLVWGTSLICIILAHVFRLNHVALQSVNFMLFPVHLALLIPFFKLGAWLFPRGPQVPSHIFAALIRNPGLSLHILGWITLKSLAAWLLTVFPATLLAYGILRTFAFGENSQTKPPGSLLE